MSPRMRAAGKLNASPSSCARRFERGRVVTALRNTLGGESDRFREGEQVRGGQKHLRGLSQPRKSGEALLFLTCGSGAIRGGRSEGLVRPLQLEALMGPLARERATTGSPDRSGWGMSRVTSPSGKLRSMRKAFSGQGRGGVGGFPSPPGHKLPEGS